MIQEALVNCIFFFLLKVFPPFKESAMSNLSGVAEDEAKELQQLSLYNSQISSIKQVFVFCFVCCQGVRSKLDCLLLHTDRLSPLLRFTAAAKFAHEFYHM